MLLENIIKPPAPIFDTHAHYDDDAFDSIREELFKEMTALGVGKIINNATDLEGSAEKCLELSRRFDFCLSAIGLHPGEVERYGKTVDVPRLKQLCEDKSVVAVGEIGLDYHYSSDRKQLQIEAFRSQMEVANELGLPVIIHDREAHADTFEAVKALRPRGTIHCFSGSKELAQQYVDLGLYIGVGGVVTFKNSRKLVEVCEAIPLERILLETDAPYLAPEPFRGKLCTSAHIYYTAAKIAEIKGVSLEQVLTATFKNAEELYLNR